VRSMPRGSALKGYPSDFRRFHEANPDLYRALRGLALDAVDRGHRRLSINALSDIARMELSDDEHRVRFSNNYRPSYARLLMEHEPKLAGRFVTKKTWRVAA
jgi:hypothetical protein